MNKLIIDPRWIWEEPGFNVGVGEPDTAHGFGGNLCHSGKMEKRGWELSKTCYLFWNLRNVKK